jgi:hypothetical protein
MKRRVCSYDMFPTRKCKGGGIDRAFSLQPLESCQLIATCAMNEVDSHSVGHLS